MKTDVFHLQILPVDKILPHEVYDETRSKDLAQKLKADKIIRNPIIVTNLKKGLYVQLDGMNRLSTIKLLGLKSIVCQIVDYQDMENVELSSWTHFVNVNTADFMRYLEKVDDLIVNKGDIDDVRSRYVQSEGFDKICTLVTEDYEVYLVIYGGSLLDKIKVLNKIVDYYRHDIVRGVLPLSTAKEDVKFLFKEHLRHKQMLVFPTFTRHQILKVVRKGGLFPPGITRHVIKRRCLNVNLPLREIGNKLSIATQNKHLEAILRARRFRLYEEPTIYFE